MDNQVKSYESDLYIWCPCIFDVFSWSWALHWNNLEGFDDGYCMGAIRTYINISPPISVEFYPWWNAKYRGSFISSFFWWDIIYQSCSYLFIQMGYGGESVETWQKSSPLTPGPGAQLVTESRIVEAQPKSPSVTVSYQFYTSPCNNHMKMICLTVCVHTLASDAHN